MRRNIFQFLHMTGWMLIFLLMTARLSYGQISDTTPPQVRSLDISPRSIDVTSAGANVTVTMRVTDDLSGVKEFTPGVNWWISGVFTSPTGDQSASRFFVRVSGDSLDGIYTAVFPFPRFTDSGVWNFDIGAIQDNALNRVGVSTAALQGQGFATDLTVTSAPDNQAPQLTGISFSPAALDVSAADQPLTVTLATTDDVSGVELFRTFVEFVFTLRSPSGSQLRRIVNRELRLNSGTPLAGTWEATINFPQFSEPGLWRVTSVVLYDTVGNRTNLDAAALQALGVTTDLNVFSVPADTMPPQLVGFSFSPVFLDTSVGPQQLIVTAQISDDLAGVTFERDSPLFSTIFGAILVSPSGAQRIPNTYLFVPPFNLLSGGSPQNGVWQAVYVLPQFAEAGNWTVSLATKDRVRNTRSHSPSALNAGGFPSQFTVVRPSLEPDGIVSALGDTVMDSVFGVRASVEFPPGVLTTSTEVAIDVFSSPLSLPTPSGYTGAGTLFVNINLAPQPVFPLPSPGLTIVLPLGSPMASGDRIDLFRVSPATGTLVPALDTSGQPVVGMVDAGGVSATFVGVSRLSVVVGLLPATIQATIDVKPGSDPSPIQIKSRGSIPVVILSTANLDASLSVQRDTLTFGRAGDERSLAFCSGEEDVNGDERPDLICHFHTELTGFQTGDVEAVLKGRTIQNLKIQGSDRVRILSR